jgi:spore maturation protein CgeB
VPTDPLQQRYPKRFHESVFGLENFRVLGRSRLTFNCHIDCAENSAGNVRLFEATGMGTCLITDWKTNLPQLFEPDTEVVTYKSLEECVEKVNYLLEHEPERQRIAAAGQKRTLRDHTFEKRAAQLDEIVRRMMSAA